MIGMMGNRRTMLTSTVSLEWSLQLTAKAVVNHRAVLHRRVIEMYLVRRSCLFLRVWEQERQNGNI